MRLLHCIMVNKLISLSYCTCEPDFDQIQRVKHNSGHHTSTESCDQVFYLDVTEDCSDISGY